MNSHGTKVVKGRVCFQLEGWNVEDRNQEIISKYELVIYNTYRTRGALLLETNQGLKLMCNYEGSDNRLEFEDTLKSFLLTQGYFFVDSFVRNDAGTIITANSSGDNYIIKDWFDGEECNLKKDDKIRLAASNLADLHRCLTGVFVEDEWRKYNTQQNLMDIFEKRTRELKRVKSYIRDRKQKNNFEVTYLSVCEEFYKDALSAMELLKELSFNDMLTQAINEGSVCHGNYTYHNVLVLNQSLANEELCHAAELKGCERFVATTNFEKAMFGLQVTDLYQFIRKTMEKNDWNVSIGNHILEEYQKIKPLSKREMKLLYILLLYPEKFWKITNFYYNNKKSWIPQKNVLKLITLQEQMSLKTRFLEKIETLISTC